MSFTLFSSTTTLTGSIALAAIFSLQTFEPAAAQTPRLPMAQAAPIAPGPIGCRITRDQIGVYQEPNLSETAVGILAQETTITLGSGSGNGWARIVAPQTGWVQAKFLRGNVATPCPPRQSSAAAVEQSDRAGAENASVSAGPGVTNPGITNPGATNPDAITPGVTNASTANTGSISRAVCAVLPEGGLIVRDRPSLDNSRVIGSIRPGNYTFQFARDRRVDPSERQWAYITAPAKGWVSTGIVNGGTNLSGAGCAS